VQIPLGEQRPKPWAREHGELESRSRAVLPSGRDVFYVAAFSETEGEANVLDNSHTRGNLHRTRNQRLPAGRVLIHDAFITIDDERIKSHLDRVVRGTVEETLNALLDAEADRLCNAQRIALSRLLYRRTNRRPGLCYPAKDQRELAAECRRLKSMLVPDKRPSPGISSCAHAAW
jgi:hypothetical protein